MNRDVVTQNLYCFGCGYNLRGLSGDPIRCPECGQHSRLEDLTVPAKLITKALRQLETGAALCGATTSALLYWLLPLLGILLSGLKNSSVEIDTFVLVVIIFFLVAIIVSIIFCILGMIKFRDSCDAKPGWLRTLSYFTVLAWLIAGLGTAAIAGVLWLIVFGQSSAPWSTIVLACMIGSLVAAYWVYRYARKVIHHMQRETAARFAREHWPNKLSNPIRET